jgi:putative transposase
MEQACESGRLELLWVDQGYSGEKFAHAICASQQRFAIAFLCGAKVEVVKRTEAGFQVLPRRWVVERNEGLVGTLSTPQ